MLLDHYSDIQYLEKQIEHNIMPIKLKCLMTGIILFCKIINSLISITLPDCLSVTESSHVRNTRNTADIVDRMLQLLNDRKR